MGRWGKSFVCWQTKRTVVDSLQKMRCQFDYQFINSVMGYRWGNFFNSCNCQQQRHWSSNVYWRNETKLLSHVSQIILDINQFNQHSQKLVKQENVMPLGLPIYLYKHVYLLLLVWRKKKKIKLSVSIKAHL